MAASQDSSPENDYLSETAYTHFRTINVSCDLELTGTVDEDESHKENDDDSPSKLRARCLRCCEVFLLAALVIIVWIVLSLPSVFFILAQDGKAEIKSNSTDFNTTTNGACKPVEYSGSTCQKYLKSYQSCLSKDDLPNVFIPESVDQTTGEEKAGTLIAASEAFASDKCGQVLRPVGCLYLFPLCDKSTRKIIRPTYGQCEDIKNNACSDEWKLAESFGAGDKLPKCEILPTYSPPPASNCSRSASCGDVLTCRDEFHVDEASCLCVPTCMVWSPYSEVERRVSDLFVILAASFAIISGVVVLILSCVRCRKVFRYPSIFIVYQTIPTMVLGALVLVGYIDRGSLFCASRELMHSFRNPTVFCTISGICLYYIMAQLLLLWFFHVIAMFWGVQWPIHANAMLSSSLRRVVLHVIAVLLALFLPTIPVILLKYSGGFTITRFPPILCAGLSMKVNFYAFMLPTSVVIACGLSLVILIFWRLLKKRAMHRIHQTRIDTNWGTHARVLTILCYFVVFGIVVLTTFTVSTINFDIFYKKLLSYFICEAKGLPLHNSTSVAGDCNKESITSLVNPITTTIAFVVIGLYPAVNLVFAIHIRELKEKCSCCTHTREVEYTYRASRPYSSYQDGWNSSGSTAVRSRRVKAETQVL